MNGYAFTKQWFDFARNNPDKVSPSHGIVYLWLVELCNLSGWADKFRVNTDYGMNSTGIRSRSTWSKVINDLINWELVIVVQQAANQNSVNVFALSNFGQASDQATSQASDNTINTALVPASELYIKQKTKKQKNKLKDFIPPSKDEWVKYFNEKGYDTEIASTSWDGYHEANWTDSKGNQINNWKQKANHVWFKPENKTQAQNNHTVVLATSYAT